MLMVKLWKTAHLATLSYCLVLKGYGASIQLRCAQAHSRNIWQMKLVLHPKLGVVGLFWKKLHG